MKKRLRKKLRKGEFQEFGFEVRFRFRAGLSEQEQDAFIDEFLEEAVEAQSLGFGGGGREEWSGYVAKMGRGTATEENRVEMKRWLSGRSEIVEHGVGELTDAWYGV